MIVDDFKVGQIYGYKDGTGWRVTEIDSYPDMFEVRLTGIKIKGLACLLLLDEDDLSLKDYGFTLIEDVP